SIGLHQRDNARLIRTLLRLRDLGNTLIVVEHDEEMMRAADWVIDIGPGAGIHGGRVIAEGKLADIGAVEESLTGQYLTGKRQIPGPKGRLTGNGQVLRLRGNREYNLPSGDVDFPLGTFIAVTGVSGSGKSWLVSDTLCPKLAQDFHRARSRPGTHGSLESM